MSDRNLAISWAVKIAPLVKFWGIYVWVSRYTDLISIKYWKSINAYLPKQGSHEWNLACWASIYWHVWGPALKEHQLTHRVTRELLCEGQIITWSVCHSQAVTSVALWELPAYWLNDWCSYVHVHLTCWLTPQEYWWPCMGSFCSWYCSIESPECRSVVGPTQETDYAWHQPQQNRMHRNRGGEAIRTTVSQSYGRLHFSPAHQQHPKKAGLNYESHHLSVACLRLRMNHSNYRVVADTVTHCTHLRMVNWSKTVDFMGCRKIRNNTYESTPNYPPIIVSTGARKSDASKPKFQKHIHKWVVMLRLGLGLDTAA